MDVKDWIALPQQVKPKGLSEEESFEELVKMMWELDKERGRSLTDKQVDALKKVIKGLIQARACVTYY
jgi:hypothetical protein